jgi:ankyrin repeat protein
MEYLINSNDDIEIRDSIRKITSGEISISKEDHSKVFLWACENGDLEIVELLIGNIELNRRDLNNTTPFLRVCCNGYLKIVKLFIATPGFNSLNTPDVNNITPIWAACEIEHLEIVKVLIATPGFDSVNISCSSVKTTPFLLACCYGHLEIAKLLIAIPEFNSLNTPCSSGRTPFYWACIHGYLEIAKLLIAIPEFNSLNTPCSSGKTPFYWACRHGYLEIAKLLIATHGFDSLNTPDNDTNETPFYWASLNGHLEIVKLLIATPGFNSLNTQTVYKKTSFLWLCETARCLETITFLLLQDNLIRPSDTSQFSEEVQNTIKYFDTNRTYYMKKYKTSLIIDIYRLAVFLSDDYLQIKSSKFFKIIKELPTELQIKIIFATVNWHQTHILTNDFNDGLKEFVRKIEN